MKYYSTLRKIKILISQWLDETGDGKLSEVRGETQTWHDFIRMEYKETRQGTDNGQ